MGILCIVVSLSIACLAVADLISADVWPQFSVLDYGAVGDGVADDTQAFWKAWAATCGATNGLPTMIIPKGQSFVVKPIQFLGPCKSSNVTVQIMGNIVAPDTPSTWQGVDATKWLVFDSVNGLTVDGFGVINGRGSDWWSISCRFNPRPGCNTLAPTALTFNSCNDLRLSDLKFWDGPEIHVAVINSQRVEVINLDIEAPEYSPNTDGIHIQASQHVRIERSFIGTGDDCISIGTNIYDVIINNIVCGPGHGISIGSLGRGRTESWVEEVSVKNATFVNTTNGARIKTWQGGKGHVRGISFEHLTFNNVSNPIIIDQYYCDASTKCPSENDAVRISNVTYANFEGTSYTPAAVSLNCSQSAACTDLHFNFINITSVVPGTDTWATCINAQGYAEGYMYPRVNCLRGH